MTVKIELPLSSIESLFTALHSITPSKVNRLEMKSIALLKNALYFELERMLETQEEKDVRKTEFKKLFEEQRQKRLERIKEVQERR